MTWRPDPKPEKKIKEPKIKEKKVYKIKKTKRSGSYKNVYWNFFGYELNDFVACEICGNSAVDIHHIECAGMGGSIEEEKIENLMALCRHHHDLYGDRVKFKEMLINTHQEFIKNYVK